MTPDLEAELTHYYSFDFGPASPGLGGTGGGSTEQREPRLPYGANLWTIQTAIARLKEADREMGRVYFSTNADPPHTVMPSASDVLHAYYGEGVKLSVGERQCDPLVAVYPLTSCCPENRDGTRIVEALWRFAEHEANAKGEARKQWEACRVEAQRLLENAQQAYRVAASRVERVRRRTLAERTKEMLG